MSHEQRSSTGEKQLGHLKGSSIGTNSNQAARSTRSQFGKQRIIPHDPQAVRCTSRQHVGMKQVPVARREHICTAANGGNDNGIILWIMWHNARNWLGHADDYRNLIEPRNVPPNPTFAMAVQRLNLRTAQ